MTSATLDAAKELSFRIQKLRSFIDTTRKLNSFCNGFGVAEDIVTTAEIKRLLLEDLEAKLKQEEQKFTEL